MAKKLLKSKQESIKPKIFFDMDLKIEKYIWLVIPLFTLIYYMSSRYSQGFYQDDEIAQYLNMLQFWIDPTVILGNNPKPGYKILMVLPAYLNYNTVLLVNSLLASCVIYFTFRLLRLYKLNFSFLGALLLGVQPLFFDLSFRSYSEIFTSLLIVIFLMLYKKKFYFLSGLIAGYIFTVRQEIVIFLVILSVIFIYRKQYLPLIALCIFPLLYDILGYFKTGDVFFVISEMRSVASLNYASQGILHYFKFYIFIVGPVSLLLFLFGFLGFFKDLKNFKKYIYEYSLQYLIFITVFVVQLMTMINDGPNPGNWRYLLHISPICVFFAIVGFNNILDRRSKTMFYTISISLVILTLFFLSKTSDGFKFYEPEKSDFTKVIFLIFLTIITAYYAFINVKGNINNLAVIYLIAAVIYITIDYKPKKLSPENIAVKSAAEYINKLELKDKNIYTNHAVLMFFSDDYGKNPGKYKTLNSKNLLEVPANSLIVWDNHYGYRPEFKDADNVPNDIKLEILQKDSTYKFLNQISAADKRFTVYIFEKIQ